MQRSSTRGGPEVVGRGELPPELAYVTLVQISGKYVLNEALFANLVRFFCAEGRYTPDAPKRSPAWLYSLPRMAVQPRSASPTTARTGADGGQEALALALCATTAAYSGIEARNTGMLEYASRLYGEALRAQGRAVAGHAGGKKSVGMDMVAASVMLGMFEAVVATTGRAYAEHVVGAAKMLDVAMSQSLKAGGRPGPLLTHIFFHTRIQLAFVYLTSTEKRIRSDAVIQKLLIDVCGWPYEKLPLDQQVIRPLALLIGSTFDHENYKDGNVFSRRRAIYWEAQDAVSTLWSRYSQASSGQNLFWTNQSTGMMDFREPFSAIQHAFFSACRILLERLSPAHNPTPTNASPPTVAAYLRARDVGFSYLRIHLPLCVVALYAPKVEQRRAARRGFEEWERGALRGIGALGLERLAGM
ncbi:hypothetical protein K458DRAFT_311772 [Lentithecium fluviatile CBS 122367]|uniref:Uncharacterized protein n=1 Tax=Lentithecium fluviatile CBS 122367 TaxID=1168545 RepID=A0A6G1IRQ1_9PLEO|nr:hypothetical protein K458DRAFT_311772 [Lentithecium fluviatile CBS 122367]